MPVITAGAQHDVRSTRQTTVKAVRSDRRNPARGVDERGSVGNVVAGCDSVDRRSTPQGNRRSNAGSPPQGSRPLTKRLRAAYNSGKLRLLAEIRRVWGIGDKCQVYRPQPAIFTPEVECVLTPVPVDEDDHMCLTVPRMERMFDAETVTAFL